MEPYNQRSMCHVFAVVYFCIFLSLLFIELRLVYEALNRSGGAAALFLHFSGRNNGSCLTCVDFSVQ